MRLALIRHGPTEWNAAGLLQGRTDVALSAAGRQAVADWRLPETLATWPICASPLIRAQQTASLLSAGRPVSIEPDLIEMNFGAWEGQRLADLRARDPLGVAANEDRGLDFQPPGGESPRAVQARLHPLLQRWAAEGQDRVAVTHKGVIRALFAAAMEWNMLGKPPVKLRWAHAHVFRVSAASDRAFVRAHSLNIPLSGEGL